MGYKGMGNWHYDILLLPSIVMAIIAMFTSLNDL